MAKKVKRTKTKHKNIYLNESTNKYEDLAGTVSSVTIKSGTPYLNVGDKEVPFSDVQLSICVNVVSTSAGRSPSFITSNV